MEDKELTIVEHLGELRKRVIYTLIAVLITSGAAYHFIDEILAGRSEGAVQHGVAQHSACCAGAVGATMTAVAAYGGDAGPRLVDYYLSYDVQPSSSFVGYAGVVL